MTSEVEPKDFSKTLPAHLAGISDSSPTNIQKIDNDAKSEGELEIDLCDDEHDSVKELQKMAEKNGPGFLKTRSKPVIP